MMEIQESGKNQSQRPKKSRKKRMKAIFTKLKDQMEFYFGDANLHKDRFMKKIVDESPDGYVDLDIFLKFNKIAALTDSVKVIADALTYQSSMLEINADGTKVRRTTPISEPVNVDERTVYVECLPHNTDHEWVKKLFSACGRVTYVSLPRYPSTRDLKGFAFVEFETIEGATTACQELNNPPVDSTQEKIGMFPKSSHQLDALKKKIPEEQIKETEGKMREILYQAHSGDKIQGNEEISEETEADKTDNVPVPSKRQRTISENSNEGATPSKRRRSDNQSEIKSINETEKPGLGNKKKSRKRKSRSKTCESNQQDSDVVKSDSELDKSTEVVPEKKLKLEESNTKEIAAEEGGFPKSSHKENTGQKKKKRLRKKKVKKEKEVPELRVIPKTEWLKLREEYLDLQKTNMKLLKQRLNEKRTGEKKDKLDKKQRKEIQFIPNVIVKVQSEEAITRKMLKESFKEDIQIAYLDIHDGLCDGFIRCDDAESATKLVNTSVDTVTFTLLSGEEEKQYWDKLALDRETKLNTKGRSKKRGHQKLMDKAQKASLDTAEKKHIIFEDD